MRWKASSRLSSWPRSPTSRQGSALAREEWDRISVRRSTAQVRGPTEGLAVQTTRPRLRLHRS